MPDPSTLWTAVAAVGQVAGATAAAVAAGAAMKSSRATLSINRESREALARALEPTWAGRWSALESGERYFEFVNCGFAAMTKLTAQLCADGKPFGKPCTLDRLEPISHQQRMKVIYAPADGPWVWRVPVPISDQTCVYSAVLDVSDERSLGVWRTRMEPSDDNPDLWVGPSHMLETT